MMAHTAFSQWLEGKFLEWMTKTGRRRTVVEFSRWLDIPRPLLSRYLNGSRRPTKANIDKISAKLGAEVYDLLGLQRPDPLLQSLQANWDKLTEAQREQIRQILDQVQKNT